MRFYTKNNPNKADRVTREQVSQMLPTKFKEQVLRVYCKCSEKEKIEAAKRQVHSILRMEARTLNHHSSVDCSITLQTSTDLVSMQRKYTHEYVGSPKLEHFLPLPRACKVTV